MNLFVLYHPVILPSAKNPLPLPDGLFLRFSVSAALCFVKEPHISLYPNTANVFLQYTELPDEYLDRSRSLCQLWGMLEYLPGTV